MEGPVLTAATLRLPVSGSGGGGRYGGARLFDSAVGLGTTGIER